jgi:hypothetical protein
MDAYTPKQLLYHYFSRLKPSLRIAITDYNIVPINREELYSLATKLEKNHKDRRGLNLGKPTAANQPRERKKGTSK